MARLDRTAGNRRRDARIRGANAARHILRKPRSGPASGMSRKGFLKTTSTAVAGISAAAMGLGGAARAAAGDMAIDVYPSGQHEYVGPEGLEQALNDIHENGTVRVHAWASPAPEYDIGETRLTVDKGMTIVGLEGRPEIRCSDASGVIKVNAPGASVELNNLHFKSTSTDAKIGYIIEDNGSISFRVIGCDAIGSGSGGIGFGMSIGGSSYDSKDVTGEIIIRESSFENVSVTGIWIGWYGPVYMLDYVEVSGCVIDPAGGGEPYNNGNYGLGLTPTFNALFNYAFFGYHPLYEPWPFYLEPSHGGTVTRITGNRINSGNPLMYWMHRGLVEITDNILEVSGYLPWNGNLIAQGIIAAGSQYPMIQDVLDEVENPEIPFSKGIIHGNSIRMGIPALPYLAPEFSNAIQIGASSVYQFHFPDTFFADGAEVTGNTVTNMPWTDGKVHSPQYGIWLEGSGIEVRGNDLSRFSAKVAQAYVGAFRPDDGYLPHGNLFEDNSYGPLDPTYQDGELVTLAGLLIEGYGNASVNDSFRRCNALGGAPGWNVPITNPYDHTVNHLGCVLLTETSEGNSISGKQVKGKATWLGPQDLPPGTDWCNQVLDQGDGNSVALHKACRNPHAVEVLADVKARNAARKAPGGSLEGLSAEIQAER